MVVPTSTTTAGLRKEQQTMVDGTFEQYSAFDLNATFENFVGEPLSLLFQIWEMYPPLVFEGMITPYIDLMTANELDYNTRIYRFIMDPTNTYITKAACTGASFPNSSPTGKYFDMDRTKPLSEQMGSININFKSDGAIYFDDIVLKEFNMVQTYFNKGIEDYLIDPESSSMEKIPRDLLPEFDNKAYPVVNLDTYELEWIVSKYSETYKRFTEGINPLGGIEDDETIEK
jgi:hypothetical protein